MPDKIPSDEHLIQAHLKGSATALAQLWLRYDSLVYGLAHSVVCRRDAAEDIRQEVFLAVYEQLHQLREYGKFSSWVSSITYNTSKSWLRRSKPAASLETVSEGVQAVTQPDLGRREQRSLLRQMIDRLPEKERMVIELHYFAEQRVAEIADFLNLPESTAKDVPQASIVIAIFDDAVMLDGEMVASVSKSVANRDLLIATLADRLDEAREKAVDIARRRGNEDEFVGKVSIQGDRDIDFAILQRVMYTCSMTGYEDISLAVIGTS